MTDPAKIAASQVPILDGTNYKRWSSALLGLFRYAGSYRLVIGEEKKPQPVTSGQTVSNQKEIDDWVMKSDREISYMHNHYFDDKTKGANEIWEDRKSVV